MAGVQEEEEVEVEKEVWSYSNRKVAGGVGNGRPGSPRAGNGPARTFRARISAPEYFWPQLLAVIVIGRSRSPGNTGNSNAFQTKAPEGQQISGGYRWERAG